MTPSSHQEAIYEHRKSPRRSHAVVRAAAGAGKTFTIVEFFKQLRRHENGLYVPFNKAIADEGREKLSTCPNVEVRTLHAFCNSLLYRNRAKFTTAGRIELDKDKNEYILRSLLDEDEWNKFGKYMCYNFSRSVDLLKDFAFDPSRDLGDLDVTALLVDFDLLPEDHILNQCDMISLIIQNWDVISSPYVKDNTAYIDYSDQIYLVYKHRIRPPIYAWVAVDEAQDLNPVQWEIVYLMAEWSSILIIGDPWQCIYEFRGASYNGMTIAADKLKAKVFDLPVCYRCGTSIIREAQKINPIICSPPGMASGEVVYATAPTFYTDVNGSDAVIARTNAELVDIAHELRFTYAKRVYIKGDGALKTMQGISKKAKLVRTDDPETMKDKLESYYLHKVAKRNPPELPHVLQQSYDALLTASEKFDDWGQVEEFLLSVFTTEPDNRTISLSTIHRFKGLEADRVYYINPRLNTDNPAEDRIAYVAITRARRHLVYVRIPRKKKQYEN